MQVGIFTVLHFDKERKKETNLRILYFEKRFPRPLLPTLLLSCLLASYFCTDRLSWLGLGNQAGSTTDHLANSNLPSTPKDRSTLRAEAQQKLFTACNLKNFCAN